MPQTLVLEGPRRLRLSMNESRPLQPGEVRLRSRLSGISHGTELSLYRGTSAFTDRVFDRGLRAFVAPHAGAASAYPVTLGYEMVSEVVEVRVGLGSNGQRETSTPRVQPASAKPGGLRPDLGQDRGSWVDV
jgi:threonine dehydrogenase-like Zn-dependent dehydrogenase